MTQILYLKIFSRDFCKVHVGVADFSNYVALLKKSSFHPICLFLSVFLQGDEVSTKYCLLSNKRVLVILHLSVLPGQHPTLLPSLSCSGWQDSDFCGLHHVNSPALCSASGDTSWRLVDGR